MRWVLGCVLILIALFFALSILPREQAPPPVTIAAPASPPVEARPLDKPVAPPPPLVAPKLSDGFCDPPGEAAFSRSLKASDAANLHRAIALLHTSAFADAAPLLDTYLAS